MNPPAKLSDLIDLLEMESPEYCTRFDRHTGQIVSVDHSILSAVEEGRADSLTDLPDWQKKEVELARALCEDAGERFLRPPDKFEFHEYRQMERFIGTWSPGSRRRALARNQRKRCFPLFQRHPSPARHSGRVASPSR